MQLKNLEMLGFKSFPDKTTVTFQPGVTAVVGPNGCGKSNISDAIRWVLGEQSAKHLRGDKMEDVIFNGSESRKPLGMSEVTLTLTDVAGRLPSGFGEYAEIEISRRLYRSGESEYLINKIPCRLKDIRDLMMDAGVGAKIHAIIEQDRVDQILSSKPQDRRFLFEEVAGVMKYKARRQEALSKLDSTQQNQVRINDILAEVKRQVNSLDRQAKKAERYQRLHAEMRDIDQRLASVEYSNLGLEWAAATEEFNKTENEITALHASLGRIEAGIEETRAEALIAERELTELQNGIHETESALSRAEHRVEMSRSQIASLTEQRGRDLADIEYLKHELAQAAARKRGIAEELSEAGKQANEKNRILSEKTAAFEALSQALKEKEHLLEKNRAGVYSAMNESSAEKTKLSNLQARLAQIVEEEARASKEAGELSDNMNKLAALLSDKERELSEIKSRRETARQDRMRVSVALEQALAKKKSLEGDLGAAKDRLASQGSRLRSLIELEQNLEGYQKGVQTVMSARKEAAAAERIGTIHGLVADMIETEPRYELAIEAVLGDRLQYVVVDSQNDSVKAIEYLKTKSGGRSTFVPTTPREIRSEPFVKNGHTGVVGPALDVVRCKDSYKNVAQYLLGDVVVVDTLDTARHLWDNNGFHKTLVTLSGEIIDPWGAVTGGAVENGNSGILAKRREIKDLEREVAGLSGRVSELELALSEAEAETAYNKKAESEVTELLHRTELELINKENDGAAVREDLARTEQRSNVLASEDAERTARKKGLEEELEKCAAALLRLEQGRTTAEENIETIRRDIAEQRESLETRRAEITELMMAVAGLQEKRDAIANNLSSLAKNEADLSERLKKREGEISDIASKLKELESSITAVEEEIRKYIETLEGERAVMVSRRDAHNVKLEAQQGLEEQARNIRHDMESVQKRLSSNEVKRTELRMKIEHLKDNIRNSYHTELEAVVTGLGRFEIKVDEARLRLGELRQKLDQMGPINVDALQEYNELKERYDLLSTQQNDISESIDNLKKTIAKLDEETRELFTNAFSAIHDKFKEVFSLLFDGGRAELLLLDETNILESGIEIIAQPRGKKFQSISLLSGGERALTAIALLFAAFLVKPSPFCMLDEVDAPLDEANVTRYTRLLREMSSRSQFIVITHNKRTMEMADALYGITMEEPGCSKVVSVNLREPVTA